MLVGAFDALFKYSKYWIDVKIEEHYPWLTGHVAAIKYTSLH